VSNIPVAFSTGPQAPSAVPVPVSVPPVLASQAPPIESFAPRPAMESYVSPQELAMFDASKRGRRVMFMFVGVLVAIGAAMGIWASMSR
jgi:hypothetical protein